MSKRTNTKQQGFTIIEVVLVLAIAAMIFLIVFLAVPALQRSQRDTQRHTDIGRLRTAITNYSGNHQGTLPTVDNAFLDKYLRVNSDKFQDPRGTDYTIDTTTNPDLTIKYSETAPKVYYKTGVTCNDDGTFKTGAATRVFAISMVLESGDLYCLGNG